jgi:glutathione S-transferase
MILYNFNSTSPRRVRIYLAEKGIEVPMVNVDIFNGEQRTEAFLAKNPFGGVPVLELDDGVCIPESMAICRYFEALHPEPPLFGATPLEKAMVEVWVRRLELYLLQPVGQVWINDSPVTRGRIKDPNLKAAEAGRRGAHRTYGLLNAHLANNEFLAGDTYSAADASGLALMDFAAKRVAVPYGEELVNLKRWHEALSRRPSALAGLPGETEPF